VAAVGPVKRLPESARMAARLGVGGG
jgi:hypothetical protein